MTWNVTLYYVALVLGVVLALVTVIKIIRTQFTPSAKIAWLLLIILLPFAGVPLYLIFGGRKLRRKARSKADIHLLALDEVPPHQAAPLDHLLRSFGLPGATPGNRITLQTTGGERYEALAAIIRNAQHSLHLCTFSLGWGEVGRSIVDMLAERARDGVRVRLLLDDVGCMYLPKFILRPLLRSGGSVAWFMPVFSPVRAFNLNLRNHRKIVVADDRIAMSGGANLSNKYMGPPPWRDLWRDLSFTVEGPAVRQFSDIFRSDWEYAHGETIDPPITPPDQPGAAIAQVVPSGPDVPRDIFYDCLLSLIFQAQHRLWLVTPYFIPDYALEQALRLAARKGVDLRIILPHRSDHLLADLARAEHLRTLQEAGARICLCPAPMLHAKALLVDNGPVLIGSANLDVRSLLFNYESIMVAYDTQTTTQITDWMQTLMANTRTGIANPGPVRAFCESLAGIAAPLL
ncbi:MAG: phosphatidylserine/phosphatidylglycerophosphate/cardiolipin synthase family protein [Desulfovibrionaceae bacterium]